MKKIVLASANAHKLEEIKEMLKDIAVEILSLWDFNLQDLDIIEDGDSFEANAIIKAKYVHDLVKLPVIADDSGLCVDKLDSAPGIYSARYAGVHGDDLANNIKLLADMEKYDDDADRRAKFVCAIALVGIEEEPMVFRGEVEGILLKAPAGKGGFGYDPLFYYPKFKKSFGEIAVELKNSVSHRSNALKLFKNYMSNICE